MYDEPPVWLLDVDGVINANRPGHLWKTAPWHATIAADFSYKLRWSPHLIRRIRTLQSQGLVEIRWCTSWCSIADLLELAFSFPALPRALDARQCNLPPGQLDVAKADAALAVWRENRRLIWTDDTAVLAAAGLHAQLTAGGRGLLIAPDHRYGLGPQDMEHIELYAARVVAV